MGSALALGSRLGLGVGLSWVRVRVGLGLRSYLDPTRKCFLTHNERTARPLEDPTGHSVDTSRSFDLVIKIVSYVRVTHNPFGYE